MLNGEKHIVVPHQPAEAFLLQKLGFDVPSPILTHYEWPHPIGAPPFEVQKKTSALLSMSQRAYVLNGMGTGKTRAALWGWDYLRGIGLANKALVVAPLSTLKFTWSREVFNTLPHRKCVVLHGDRKRRLDRLADPDAEIFIINHDGLRLISKEIEARPDIDTLVIDELAVYRNGGAARTKHMRKFAQRMKWVWGMTGAPIPTSPTDVWAQAKIVTPLTVPDFFNKFRDHLMVKVSNFKYAPKTDAVERAFGVLQPAVRYTLGEVTELPEAVGLDPPRLIDVELGPQQAKAYKSMLEKCHIAIQSQQITAANAGAAMMKLLQVATGWVYTADGRTIALDNGKRIEALIDAVNSTDNKVLVFAPFKHALEGISAALTSEVIDHVIVSGDTPEGERSRIFTLFQTTNRYRVIVAHPQCLAHGITLTAADTIIWFAPTTSLEIYDQANHRIRRVGQKNKQLYMHFQSTPVERKIYKMLHNKQVIQDKLLALFEEASE